MASWPCEADGEGRGVELGNLMLVALGQLLWGGWGGAAGASAGVNEEMGQKRSVPG